MDDNNIIFPFSAVQGQPLLKLALLLAAVNPLMGGVLIAGPRGSGKSTLARGLADLLPVNATHEPQFVTLAATEQMPLTSVSPESANRDKSCSLNSALFNKAHAGVLYVEEINRLPSHLVEHLLDRSSRGVNVLEEQQDNQPHEACFTLIASIAAEADTLSAKQQDRFAFMVELDNRYSLQERVNIIKTCKAFADQPENFCDNYQVEQIVLQQQISDAQKLLPTVTCSEHCFMEIATRCQQAHVQGLRADIMLHRACLTHAAWCGRNEVSIEDIDQVAPLVLSHRRQLSPASEHGADQG